ncbi:hypothetical protein SAMN05444158_3936 [Bradyrhizobium canariense]|jgi:hypothetical protein|uniref:Uncharacterized protein n=1 Tax=Bradyrhizobium canariense TaxID=255045 RepID=A0A1H1WQN7_9BRAD|nr:hypothetical protein SAMN05444158_3936 [Bradyrhizobium canariense]
MGVWAGAVTTSGDVRTKSLIYFDSVVRRIRGCVPIHESKPMRPGASNLKSDL